MSRLYDYVIVGGGIAGLSSLHILAKQKKNVLLLEQAEEVGGLLKTSKQDGYLLENGPTSFLKGYKETISLIHEMGLASEIVGNYSQASKRYIYKNGAIHSIPENPFAFFCTSLFSFKAKLRLLIEPFSAKAQKSYETVRQFGYRRLGKEATDIVMDAMISGICAGDIDQIDMHSLFPKISLVERKFKSLLLFLLFFKSRNITRDVFGKKITFRTLKRGMGSLASAIAENYSENIVLNCLVEKIIKKNDLYFILTSRGCFYARSLVMATPANTTGSLLENIDSHLKKLLWQVDYVPMATVNLGYRQQEIDHPLDGFGMLVPRPEGLRILGTLFPSGLFPGRAPRGYHTIKVYLGGAHDRQILQLTDQELIEISEKELVSILGIKGQHVFANVKRFERAIPQYNMEHQVLKKDIYKALQKHHNVFLVGNYLEGVSVNDIIKSAKKLENQSEEIPELVANDPYLVPHLPEIKRRQRVAREMEILLGGESGDISSFANGHKYFGMHRVDGGWVFREWAPNATAICLVGDFSDWKENSKYQMQKIDNESWEIMLNEGDVKHLQHYRLKVSWNGGSGDRIPSYANYVVQDKQTHIFNAVIWAPENSYQFKYSSCQSTEPPIIYESHIGMAQIEGKVSSYREFQKYTLARIAKAGYNTVQIMAIQEHPYYGSFGYQVSNFFAPSSRFGTPDELKELIDTAHGMGLRVIMDIVHSHAVRNEVEGLGKFDGTQYQYFHDGGKGFHPAWDSMCFNYGKPQVLHFLLSNCKYWLEEFRFDGFRFDGVTSMLYHSHGLGQAFGSYDDYFNMGVDTDAVIYFMLANKLIKKVNSKALSIAEDVSGMAGLAYSLDKGGIGFDYRLSMGVPDFWIKLLKEHRDEDWNMDHIWHELTNRRKDEQVICYAESHDQALVGDKTLIFWLIDKDMYTNMAVHNRNLAVDRGIALHKMIRFITITSGRGGYLNFMGNEFGHPEWIDFPRQGNGWSYHYARRQWDLVDNDQLCYRFLANFDREMLKVVKDFNLLGSDDPQFVYSHCDDRVLAFRRNNLLFVFNFDAARSYTDYMFSVDAGKYVQLMNSDLLEYGGQGRLPVGQEHFTFEGKISLYMPTRTVLVLKKVD